MLENYQQFVIKYVLVEVLHAPERSFNSISIRLSSMNSSPVSGKLTTNISSGFVDHPEGPEITDENDMSFIAKRQGNNLSTGLRDHVVDLKQHGIAVEKLRSLAK